MAKFNYTVEKSIPITSAIDKDEAKRFLVGLEAGDSFLVESVNRAHFMLRTMREIGAKGVSRQVKDEKGEFIGVRVWRT